MLYNILLYSGCNELRQQHQDGRNIDRSLLLSSALFCTKPSVSARSFRRLLRFVAGLEDFARTNAHQPQRRRIFPELGQEDLKRSCLFVLSISNIRSLIPNGTVSFPAQRARNPATFSLILFHAFTTYFIQDMKQRNRFPTSWKHRRNNIWTKLHH